jgi:response regulator RpfG family c-di-GMP phosphodiesterase
LEGNNCVFFADEVSPGQNNEQKRWKILIADDEEEVHVITRMALINLRFEGRKLSFLSAYSGVETKALLRKHPDIALVLLDVVMEHEASGLDVVRYIREELRNTFVRIVLRTGQPGQAPERRVVMEYDINDYKEKTELTISKLFTTVIGSLRAYRDLRTIEQSRQGLERIVTAAPILFEIHSLSTFARVLLIQIVRLLQEASVSTFHSFSGFVATWKQETLSLLAGIGKFDLERFPDPVLPDGLRRIITHVRHEQRGMFFPHGYVDYFRSCNGAENVICLQTESPLNDIDHNLLRIFSSNISVAFDNIYLNKAIVSTQKEVIFTLGQVIGVRSEETGNHMKRIAACSHMLARKSGIPEEDAELLRLASPMHDIGKIGLPDAILKNSGVLRDKDTQILQTHPYIGYEILKKSKQAILKTAAIIALQHHEHWNGSGYPQGLQGDDIHIFARITHLVDVFDGLCYPGHENVKWDMDHILALLRDERGHQFDPQLVDAFLDDIDAFQAIHAEYPEPPYHS